MSDRAHDLAVRHAALRLRCAAQRQAIEREVASIGARLGGVDRVAALARHTLLHPVVIVAGTLVLLTVGRVRGLHLIGRALLLVAAARRLWQVVKIL